MRGLCQDNVASGLTGAHRGSQGLKNNASSMNYESHHHMAHQTANIPWNVLASNLYWSEVRHPGHGDLHLRFRSDQAKKLEYFVQGLVRNIREHSSTSRRKYPEHYDAPDPNDVILDDATVRKIAPTVRRWCANRVARYYHPPEDDSPWNPVPMQRRAEWERQIPVEQRRAAAFYRHYTYYERTWYIHSKLFFNVEVVKTLLLDGEMDTIFAYAPIPMRWSSGRFGGGGATPSSPG